MQISAYHLSFICTVMHVVRCVNAFFCRWQSGGCAALLRAAQGGELHRPLWRWLCAVPGWAWVLRRPCPVCSRSGGRAGFYAARAMALRTLALRACRLCSGVWPEVSTVISALE